MRQVRFPCLRCIPIRVPLCLRGRVAWGRLLDVRAMACQKPDHLGGYEGLPGTGAVRDIPP